VGASGWNYVVPYQADLAAALAALRRQVFHEGSYVNPAEHGLAAPTSVEALWQEEYYWEFMGTCGTHSILDIAQVVAADDVGQGPGTVRPLTDAECRDLFGVTQPGGADYERVGESALFGCVTAGRGTGRATVLWDDGQPSEIALWGYSGD
jgi:hypothetical protein